MKRKSSSTTPPKQPQLQPKTETPDMQAAGDQFTELKIEPEEPEENPADESMCNFIHSLMGLYDNHARLVQLIS